jgi:hypothetical protein
MRCSSIYTLNYGPPCTYGVDTLNRFFFLLSFLGEGLDLGVLVTRQRKKLETASAEEQCGW